jgi:predicted nucleotidyltransferase
MEKGLKVSSMVLFGSHAKGCATDESDVDVIIISEDFEGKDVFERVRLVKDATIRTIREFSILLDIVGLTPQEFASEKSLVAEYAREGEVVYGTR